MQIAQSTFIKIHNFHAGTIFVYGQTSSGKTHTMMGEQHHAGIIPLSIGAIFDYVEDVSTYMYNVYMTHRCLVITMPVDVHVCVQP